MYYDIYSSPLGQITLFSRDKKSLCGLYFERESKGEILADSKNSAQGEILAECEIFKQTKNWLDIYFSGVCPDFTPELDLRGSAFALSVWGELLAIKYGFATSYGAIAKSLANSLGKSKIAAQAVGRAVGANPIAIIVPCHRVLGSDLSLKGYAYGLERKIALLKLEKIIYKK